MAHWKTLFHGMIGIRLVKVEKGDGIILRLSSTTPDMEDEITVQAATPGMLKSMLIQSRLFTEQDADEILTKILNS